MQSCRAGHCEEKIETVNVVEVFKNRESFSTESFTLHHQGSPLLMWSMIF